MEGLWQSADLHKYEKKSPGAREGYTRMQTTELAIVFIFTHPHGKTSEGYHNSNGVKLA